jgi:ribosomal protein S18 acetylase RimI-like enzyme
MDIPTRRAGPADVGAIAALVERSYQHYVPRIGLRPAPMDADYAEAVRTKVVWLAERNDALAGALVLEHAGDHLLVENLAVSPDCQGLGIGSRLLALAEQEARAGGLPEVRLFTHELMTENLRFYGLRGYVETERRQENGFSRVFFTKPIR